MADGLCVNLGNVVNSAVLFPAPHFEPAHDNDALAFLDAASNVAGKLSVALHGEPVRVAVDPCA
jgi:hypothetical protein